MKKNITRKLYILYLIIMLIIMDVVLILASIYSYLNHAIRFLFRIGSIGILLDIIFMIYLLIKIKRKEINNTSDERERFIISRSATITGITAFSLTPFMMLFLLVLPEYILISSFVYIFIIGGVMKIAMMIFNKKF